MGMVNHDKDGITVRHMRFAVGGEMLVSHASSIDATFISLSSGVEGDEDTAAGVAVSRPELAELVGGLQDILTAWDAEPESTEAGA